MAASTVCCIRAGRETGRVDVGEMMNEAPKRRGMKAGAIVAAVILFIVGLSVVRMMLPTGNVNMEQVVTVRLRPAE